MIRLLAALALALTVAFGPAPAAPAHEGMAFEDLEALARLPWFELGPEGRLRIKAPGVGAIIDFHAHLALGFGPPLSVDLFAAERATEHYLSVTSPFDLAPYLNRAFTPERLAEMTHDLTIESLGPGGMRATHTVPNLRREMGELGIVSTVILPIDMPFGSANAEAALAAARREPGIIPFGSVHPHTWGASAKLDAQIASGARGFKFHPAVQLTRPDDPRAVALYRRAAAAGKVIFWHCGPVGIESPLARALSQVALYERPIAENPGVTFVLGHAGALQPEQALALARRYPNVYLELSSQGLPVIEKLIAEGPSDRLLFGSDWPFYHAAIPLAKVLLATEHRPTLRRKILHDNAARLLGR